MRKRGEDNERGGRDNEREGRECEREKRGESGGQYKTKEGENKDVDSVTHRTTKHFTI